VIGEYLARIHFRTMKKPAYVVRYNSQTDENPSASSEKAQSSEVVLSSETGR